MDWVEVGRLWRVNDIVYSETFTFAGTGLITLEVRGY
jgi:hypothetical protein